MDEKNDDTIIFNEPSSNKYEHIEDGETLFEKYFKGINLNADKRNYCYMILNNIKEVVNARYVAKNQSNKFDLEAMSFRRTKINKYVFNGILSNGEESKVVDGSITIDDKNISVETNYYRFYEFLEDEDRFYSTEDTFIDTEEGYIRVTRYSDFAEFTEPADILKEDEVSDYAYEKARTLVPRKDNKMSN